ncbi:MAG TPA: radical SAM protein, partial [Bryobacteraceae bacterium]|nr:radical SAM protein [Bryobacteraceae bacterium]
REVFLEMRKFEKKNYSRFNWFQDDIATGRAHDWRCRAGSRYLYVCEDGLVHYCSQQRGYPAKPLEHYTLDDIRREYRTEKGCAPYCTVSCVHHVSYLDCFRGPQTIARPELVPEPAGELIQIQ